MDSAARRNDAHAAETAGVLRGRLQRGVLPGRPKHALARQGTPGRSETAVQDHPHAQPATQRSGNDGEVQPPRKMPLFRGTSFITAQEIQGARGQNKQSLFGKN